MDKDYSKENLDAINAAWKSLGNAIGHVESAMSQLKRVNKHLNLVDQVIVFRELASLAEINHELDDTATSLHIITEHFE
jgi:hypothetical protein